MAGEVCSCALCDDFFFRGPILDHEMAGNCGKASGVTSDCREGHSVDGHDEFTIKRECEHRRSNRAFRSHEPWFLAKTAPKQGLSSRGQKRACRPGNVTAEGTKYIGIDVGRVKSPAEFVKRRGNVFEFVMFGDEQRLTHGRSPWRNCLT